MKRTSALKIASETLYIYAPLAHRLGLYEIKSELEDHGLKHSQPEVYDEIEKKLDKVHEIQENYAQEFIRQIREELKGTKLKFKIQHRFKTVHSVYKKMKKQNVPFEEVFDLFAVRIILRSKPGMETADCWRVYSVVSHLFSPNPKRLRDWITHPKENGYEALHVTVLGPEGRWVEVQIRTERMDRVAEKGIAAHWKYKENGDQYEETLNQWIEQVRETLENPSLTALDAVREFRENLRPHNLYVFTPRGKLIRVPTGATALDFAYQIHSNIGDCAIGAKVGNELLSLDYELNQAIR
jgi:guanosine-3',5'-bis(diphosphate) 3'-pyrophosphohydrolase